MSTTPFYIRHKYALVVAGVLLYLLIAFVYALGSYLYKFDTQLQIESRARLTSVSSFVLSHMTRVVKDMGYTLHVAANAVTRLDEVERVEYLRNVAEKYSFAYMGYAGTDGKLHATLDSQSVNVLGEPFFQSAIQGQTFVSGQVRKILSYRAVSGVLFAVPMQLDNKPGVLMTLLDTSVFGTILRLETFDGEGHFYVVDREGEVILRDRSLDFANLFVAWRGLQFPDDFPLEMLAANVRAGLTGFTSYLDLAGKRQQIYYQSLSFNDWCLIHVVPEEAINGKTSTLTRELAIIGATMVFTFLGLLLWALYSRRVSQESRIAGEAKSAFLANMSHEIRTPMNAVVGLSEIMLRGELTKSQRENLTSILNSGKGLLSIINDILDISKIEAGQFSIQDAPYELGSLLYDVTIITAIRIGEKPIEFMIDVAPELPRHLVGDMGRIKQVLLNMLSNAVKFTERGLIRMTVRAERENEFWRLYMDVQDSGIGIRKDDLDKLFVRFTQVDTRRTRNVEGTGLGLTISRRLCEMMHGNIIISSEYGKGTLCRVEVQQGAATDAGAERLCCPLPEDVRVLVYEGSPAMREFEVTCMTRLNITHTMCTNAPGFEKELRTGHYTHALAPRRMLADRVGGMENATRIIGMLDLREHSFIGMTFPTIYNPLFATQLPALLAGVVDSPHQRSKQSGIDDMIEPMPYITVLVVDDNELNIMVAEGLMAPFRMTVDHAFSGQEAINIIQRKEYDMVFMDHMMPGMDGVDALHHIRALPGEKFKTLPIVALTANTTNEARLLFQQHGFDDFLSKPIETAMLNRLLKNRLKGINDKRAGIGNMPKASLAPLVPLVPADLELLELPDMTEFTDSVETFESPEFSEFTEKSTSAPQPAALPPPDTAPSAHVEMDVGEMNVGEMNFAQGRQRMPSQEFYLNLLEKYMQSTQDRLAQLPDWLENDRPRLVIEIHGMKGAGASVGAVKLAKTAAELEQFGKNGQFDKLATKLPAFTEQANRVLAEIDKYLDEHGRIYTK